MVLALPVTTSVTLEKSLHYPELGFPMWKMERSQPRCVFFARWLDVPQHGGVLIKGHIALFEGDVVSYVCPWSPGHTGHRLSALGNLSPRSFPLLEPRGRVREKMMLRLASCHDLGPVQEKA